jgi:site-specific DNA-cytosine methylase
MRVLVACEFSGVVRDAFLRKGHNAISCDFLPTESTGPHLQCDVKGLDLTKFDLMIAHPPCTHLAVSGARWFKNKGNKLIEESLDFVRFLLNAPIPRICLENPVSLISSQICKPTQIIHPWQFEEMECKTICLWLKDLPKLEPTRIMPKWMRDHSIHKAPPSIDRWKDRSRFFSGIADAMAQQWS